MATVTTYDMYGKANGTMEKGAVGTPGNSYIDMGEKIGSNPKYPSSPSHSYAQPKAAGYGQSSIQDQIDSLKASQQAAAEASLGKARDTSLSQLGADRAKIDPAYYSARNQASTQNQLGAKNFAEFMANRGQTNSGLSGQAQISSDVALQGQMGSLKTSQLGEEAENTRQVQNVNAGYQSDLVASKANIESQALQNAIAQYNTDRTWQTQKDQFAVTSAQAQQQITNQASQFASSFGLSEKELANTITQQGIQNAYQDKSFAQAADQFAQQMGLSRDQYASGLDQWAKTFNQSTSQFDQTLALQKAQLAASSANAAASRSASAARASAPKAPTATQIKAANTSNAYGDVDSAIAQGASWDTIRSNIVSNASGYEAAGISYATILNYAEAKYNAEVASRSAYPTSPQGTQQAADAITNSAFKNW